MAVVEVVGAVIVQDGMVLCAQRGSDKAQPGLWEFPGGKIERGESPQLALEREIREELDCAIRVGDPVTTTVHDYDTVTISLATFYCTLIDRQPVPSEHAAITWVAATQLTALDWAPADIEAVRIVSAHLVR